MQLGKFGKITIGWTVIAATGIYGFVLARDLVEKNRLQGMRIRERMRNSNLGEYTPSDRQFKD